MTDNKKEILISSREYTVKVIDSIKESIQKMRGNQLTEAYGIISEMAKGMGWLIEAITNIKDELLEPIEAEEINEVLAELITGIENEDHVLASDILEYELLEVLTKWETILDESCCEKCGAV